MRRLFGMVARRKASIAVGTLLVLVVAGTTVASAPGTYLRMGVINTITGNYATTLQGTVSSWVFQARNNSATSTSAAILAYSPFGGVPIDLRAKLGQPPMRVNSNVRVPLLNADRVDYYHASIPLAPNTIAVRDGANAINANVNGNVNGNATTATDANLLDSLDSTVYLNRDGRVAHTAFGSGTAVAPGPTKLQSVSITVAGSANQLVKVDASVTLFGGSDGTPAFLYASFIAEGTNFSDGFYGEHPADYYQETQTFSWMFTAAPGTHTYDLYITNDDDISYYGASMIAQTIPLLGTGATPASTSTSQTRGAPKSTRPGR